MIESLGDRCKGWDAERGGGGDTLRIGYIISCHWVLPYNIMRDLVEVVSAGGLCDLASLSCISASQHRFYVCWSSDQRALNGDGCSSHKGSLGFSIDCDYIGLKHEHKPCVSAMSRDLSCLVCCVTMPCCPCVLCALPCVLSTTRVCPIYAWLCLCRYQGIM